MGIVILRYVILDRGNSSNGAGWGIMITCKFEWLVFLVFGHTSPQWRQSACVLIFPTEMLASTTPSISIYPAVFLEKSREPEKISSPKLISK